MSQLNLGGCSAWLLAREASPYLFLRGGGQMNALEPKVLCGAGNGRIFLAAMPSGIGVS